MAIRTITLLSAALLLAACASTPADVVSIGHGNYEIAGSSATAFSSGGTEKVKLLRVANQYCAQQGKQATLVGATDTNGRLGSGSFAQGSAFAPQAGANFTVSSYRGGRRATADVVFQCQ